MSMIDIKFIRENKERVAQNLKNRKSDVDLDTILELDERRRSFQEVFDTKRAEQKRLSKEKPDAETIEKLKEMKIGIQAAEDQMKATEEKLNALLMDVPNMLHDSVPMGNPDDAQIIRTSGEPTKFDFATLNHEELGKRLDIIDTERGAKVSGNRFWYLKGKMVQLEFALLQYAMGILVKKGFTPVIPPHMVREHVLYGAGFFPAAKFEVYSVNPGEDDLFLIGTSEAPLVAYHSDEIIDVATPIRYFAFTPCYRREAGAYGKDTSGIIRGHQFDKIEIVSLAHPDASWDEHEFLLSIEEEIISGLGIPYRVLALSSTDMSPQAAKCYDIEAWMPGQNNYREITSCSNTTDYQARRLGIRYKQGNDHGFVHTLNGTAIAMGRMMVAILENYQTAEETVMIPEVLRSYCGFDEIT